MSDKDKEMTPEEEAKWWRDWFTFACADWDDVDDIEDELGRKEKNEK